MNTDDNTNIAPETAKQAETTSILPANNKVIGVATTTIKII